MKIDLITKEDIQRLENKFDLLLDILSKTHNLSTRNGVRQYLEISESTLINMMKDGRFKQDIHFTKEIKGNKTKITFIESAVKSYKKGKK